MYVDKKKLEELIDKYYGAIFAFVCKRVSCREDVENIVQKTFANTYLHEIKKAPYAFLERVALNLIRNFYRKSERNKLLICDLERILRKPIDPKKQSKLQDLKAYLRKLVQALPWKEKSIIELRYLHEPPLGYDKIRMILKCSHPTLKKYHDRAIAKLRKEIKRYLDR